MVGCKKLSCHSLFHGHAAVLATEALLLWDHTRGTVYLLICERWPAMYSRMLSFNQRIVTIITCYIHALCHIRPQPRPWQFLLLAVDLIIVTVYYMSCHRLTLIGYIQNVLVQVIAEAPWTVSSTNICHNPHWLPVNHRITYKLCLITSKTLHTSLPLWTNRPLPSIQVLTFFKHESSGQTIWHHKQLLLTGLFRFCTIYLELSASTHSPYWQIISLQT